MRIQIQIEIYCTCSQKAKNQKSYTNSSALSNKEIQDKKWIAMQCDEKITINQGEWYRVIGILGGSDEQKICSC